MIAFVCSASPTGWLAGCVKHLQLFVLRRCFLERGQISFASSARLLALFSVAARGAHNSLSSPTGLLQEAHGGAPI